jgi:hypothetical protein
MIRRTGKRKKAVEAVKTPPAPLFRNTETAKLQQAAGPGMT